MLTECPEEEEGGQCSDTKHQRGLDWTRTNMSVAHTLEAINTTWEPGKKKAN